MEELGPEFRFPEWKFRLNKIDSCSSEEYTPEQIAAYHEAQAAAAAAQTPEAPGEVAVPAAAPEPQPQGRPPMKEPAMPQQHTLHEMVCMNRIDKIAKQLDKGVGVNIPDCLGETPLFWAVSGEVVDYLVGEGADMEWRNDLCDCSAFYKFACQGKYKPLKALARHLKRAGKLSKYVDDVSSHTQRTPLHAAAHNGYVETVKELLALGADKDKQDYLGKTALDLAKSRNFDEVIALLE